MARHIKPATGDRHPGADKGKTGKVLRVLDDKTAWWSKASTRVEARAAHAAQPAGRPHPEGRPDPHVSNVQPVDPTTGKGTRVRFETDERRQAPHRGQQRHRPGHRQQGVKVNC